MKILIIEDDAGLNRGISFALEQEGYEAVGAWTLQEGYRLFEKEHPEGVILDLNNDIDTVSVENQMVRRVQRSSIQEFDLMLLKKGELIKLIRYKK